MGNSGGNASVLIDLTVAAVLVWAAVEDLRQFRIPNRAVALLAGGFFGACLLQGDGGLLIVHAAFAAFGFALLIGAFAARMIGGGDAKLLAVALLWLGPESALAFAILLLCAVLLYAAGARFRFVPSRTTNGRTRIPFGPCIAAAWLGAMGLQRALL